MGGATKPYVVEQGDFLDKLAHRFGFDAREVWEAPANAELRKKRNPNQLHPGDILCIPDEPPARLDVQHGTKNQFTASVPKVPVNLVFEVDRKPAANEACVVSGLGEPVEMQTDGSGGLALSVPVTLRELSIHFVKRNVTHAVRIGDMDPVEERSGVTKRLVHLGLMSAPRQDDPEELKDALVRFQELEGLTKTGTLNDETIAALVRAHGS